LSNEKRTAFLIKVNKDKLSYLTFLSTVPGFDHHDSHYGNVPDSKNNVNCEAIINRHLGFREKERIKRSIKKRCGKVDIDVLRLGDNPILSKDDRDMLIYCFVIAGAAATSSGLVSANILPGGVEKIQEVSAIAGITALGTFLAEIGVELRIRRNRDSR
jgi:hypothetical protein